MMSRSPRRFYLSSNGDQWLLDVDEHTGHPLIEHRANPSSGGTVTRSSIGDFLSVGHGAEQQELLRLIGSLVG